MNLNKYDGVARKRLTAQRGRNYVERLNKKQAFGFGENSAE